MSAPWIEWSGGACPVKIDDLVEVWLRDEDAPFTDMAGELDWGHCDEFPESDIIKYRLDPNFKSEEPGWEV